jgi:hypothetical protein
MEVTKKPSNSRMLKVDDQEFERMRELRYLESALKEDNVTIEIKQIVIVANRDSYGLKIIKFMIFKETDKSVLCKATVRSVLAYGSESRHLKRKDENML